MKLISVIIMKKSLEYSLLFYRVYSNETIDSKCEIKIDNLKFDFHDVLVFYKILNYTFKSVKVCTNLPIRQFFILFIIFIHRRKLP